LAFFAMDDIILHFFDIIKRKEMSRAQSHLALGTLKQVRVGEVLEQTKSHRTYPALHKNSHLLEAFKLFSIGIQRVAVINASKQIVGILSQSTILKYIASDVAVLGSLAENSANKFGLPWDRLVKIQSTVSAIDALYTLTEKGIFSCPIIDAQGKIVEHLSISDFKGLYEENTFLFLWDSVVDFIHEVRDSEKKAPRTIFHVHTKAPLKDIVKALIDHHVHQIYLQDEGEQPIGLISMTHVCNKIFKDALQNRPSLDLQ